MLYQLSYRGTLAVEGRPIARVHAGTQAPPDAFSPLLWIKWPVLRSELNAYPLKREFPNVLAFGKRATSSLDKIGAPEPLRR